MILLNFDLTAPHHQLPLGKGELNPQTKIIHITPTIPADANIAVGNFMPYRTRNPSRNNEAETGKPA